MAASILLKVLEVHFAFPTLRQGTPSLLLLLTNLFMEPLKKSFPSQAYGVAWNVAE